MRDEIWDMQKAVSKQIHDERVAKTPDRIAFAIKMFEKYDIDFSLKNQATGHFHCYRKSDGKLFQFWTGTGKILERNERGIHSLLNILARKEVRDGKT